MDQERKFKRALSGPGFAAKVRETVSVAVRESSGGNKPQIIEPVDYETLVVKSKTLLQNDPQRELVMFPHDDVSESTQKRQLRTVRSSVPQAAIEQACSLLVKECIKTYTSHWHVIHYKYSAYSGTYLQLPRVTGKKTGGLQEHVFEVDAEAEGKDEEALQRARNEHITHQGWLYKGPDSTQEASLISFTRSYKRRYFYLKQQADLTYILEFHKDDKKLEAKGSIFLDSAIRVDKNPKRGKHAFELQMQDKSFYVLAGDGDTEVDGWVDKLKKVIESNETILPAFERLRDKDASDMSPSKSENFTESLEHSMNPALMKYAKETDSMLADQRRRKREQLFSIYPEIQRGYHCREIEEDDPGVYREQFGFRFFVTCEGFKPRLQANLMEDSQQEHLSNPEPFFIAFALYDAREGKKLSEDFHYDPNSPEIRSMIPEELLRANDMLNSVDGRSSQPDLGGLNQQWLAFPKQFIFSVRNPHADIFLVARIEKVLQGGITAATEPYVKTPDIKVGTKVNRHMRTYCNRLGHYRMPFAWAARPVFKQHISKPGLSDMDTNSDFVIYKQEGSKISEEDLIKNLQDYRKPEKQGKWQPILAHLKVTMVPMRENLLPNTVTSSLVPVKPFPEPPEKAVTIEVEEFTPEQGKYVYPHTTYTNQLYVYPKALKYDSQKSFTKARNIACYVEIRDSDGEGTVPLKCIYGRPGSSVFTTCVSTAVLHHHTTPDYNEEVKIALPTQLHDRHHLVFTFYHVGCELPKSSTSKASHKKGHSAEIVVGYAWLPLLQHGRVVDGDQFLPVAVHLPAGYMAFEHLGLGRGSVGPDVKFVDGGKPVFKVKLRLCSTVYSKDQHLHNFFHHCQKTSSCPSAAMDFETSNRLKHDGQTESPAGEGVVDKDMLKFVKSLHAVDVSALIEFLPTLFNQLLRLLPKTHSEDVAMNAVRVLVHAVHQVYEVGKVEILRSYVKYVFVTESVASDRQKTIHEELAKHLKALLRPTQADQLVVGKFMNHSWFFFDVLIKSMAQHLLSTGRIKMPRNERFPSSFQYYIQMLIQSLVPHIVQKFKESHVETRNANCNLAHFVKRCFTYMDRGFVFRLINQYIDSFMPGNPKLYEYKFEFLQIMCSHEHYIPLNMPIMRKNVKNYKDLKHDYTLSDEFRKKHFLVGLLLSEVKLALNEVREIRKCAIKTLRDLLAKHAFDDRYQSKAQQARIATLYLPFITIILENKNRLCNKDNGQGVQGSATEDVSASQTDITARNAVSSPNGSTTMSLDSSQSSNSLPRTSQRDPAVLAMIAGPAAPSNLSISEPQPVDHGSNSSLASSTSSHSTSGKDSRDGDQETKYRAPVPPQQASHQRNQSLGGTSTVQNAGFVVRYDKLDQREIKNLLVCFLFVTKNLAEDILLGWFNNSSECDVLDFLTILETCLQEFQYLGRKRIHSLCIIGDSKRAMTLPVKKAMPIHNYNRASSAFENSMKDEIFHTPSSSDAEAMIRTMLEANMSSEVAMIVLDVVSLYTNNFKDQLQFQDGDNPIMHKLFDLYLHFLQSSQSESVQAHAFAALRAYINKFPKVLFRGEAGMCAKLCYEILRCCNSRLNSTRSEACALMYLLMRSNFEFSRRKSFTRVHLQMIIAVSQLISDVVGLSNSRFVDSLSTINSYASSDKAMQRTAFAVEVKDLTKRMRTVLMATAQMKEHKNDPEMLIDLQYSLAKSYASTPELRKTWLESMSKIHIHHENYSEAAHCVIHIAALVAEYLKRRESFPQGCAAFRKLSPNVEAEESGMRDDSGMQDVQYTEDHLVELLDQCAQLLEKAERYEMLGDLYRLIIPIYEKKRAFERLSSCYETLHRAYSKIVEVTRTGKRLLGKYFRVAFFGQSFFEEEDGKEYIYKEPKITGLAEICDRLKAMYTEKFGKGTVKLIMDSNKVNPQDLDPKYAYVQVSYVTPYFDEKELEERRTDYERNNNIRRFMFETPFTKKQKQARGDIADQYKRRTILTTSHAFPYVKKRILVVYHKAEELSPIEVAIDEIQTKVAELHDVISLSKPDLKKLQLKLQGSISVQVNAGPLAYAQAFLAEGRVHKYNREKVSLLKITFREFVRVCNLALELNGRLISTDQMEYQEALRKNFREFADQLSAIFGEQLIEQDKASSLSHRNSIGVFNVISATGGASTV